jgi:predicted nicotinamide N-methyase
MSTQPMPSKTPDEIEPWLAALMEFFLANTSLSLIPDLPDIKLHLGIEVLRLWDKVEKDWRAPRIGAPYWAFVWPGGQAVARYILDNPHIVSGRRVLDLGSGSGLVAITAAKAGAAHVIANDIDRLAVVALSFNADANVVAIEANADDLMYPASGFDLSQIDIVLVGDLFYDRGLGARALAFLRRCRAAGIRVLIGDPGRHDLPTEQLSSRGGYLVASTRNYRHLAAITKSSGDFVLHPAGVWELD